VEPAAARIHTPGITASRSSIIERHKTPCSFRHHSHRGVGSEMMEACFTRTLSERDCDDQDVVVGVRGPVARESPLSDSDEQQPHGHT